jgi:hypothetical protein
MLPEREIKLPRTGEEACDDTGPWLNQADLVVLPRDLVQDLLRIARQSSDAYPNWRDECSKLSKRCMELRDQRDGSGAALVSEREAHLKTKVRLKDAADRLRAQAPDKTSLERFLDTQCRGFHTDSEIDRSVLAAKIIEHWRKL